MAKAKAGTPPSFDKPALLPDLSPTKITLTTLPAGTTLHRVHSEKYEGNAFNNAQSDARFSTLIDADDKVIPTIYMASSFEAVLMETVFHDVPYVPGDKFVSGTKLDGRVHTTLQNTNELILADLTTKSLRKLGIKREELVASEKCDYAYSRAVAGEIYDKNEDVQGLRWVSRQDDTAFAYMLFGTRVDTSCLAITSASRSLVDDAYDEVLDVAEHIGVEIVPDKF